MSIFKKKVSEKIVHNRAGEEVHIFNGANGPAHIKKLDYSAFLSTGEEYCPECHKLMRHRDGYWECPTCKHSITDDESLNGDGYPSLEATYENDYEEYYGNPTNDEPPEHCKKCGGPWPECESTCHEIEED